MYTSDITQNLQNTTRIYS